MVDRALLQARELVNQLRAEKRAAVADLEGAALWLEALPDSPEWFGHWVECASNVARLRRKLDRAREELRGHRVRAVLHRRSPPPPPAPPAAPMVQLGLFDRPQRRGARPRRREQLPEDSSAPRGRNLHEQRQREQLSEDSSSPADEDVHEQLQAADLVDVEELPAGWCEACQRTQPGTQWNQRRGMRLCPRDWPAEDLQIARRAA